MAGENGQLTYKFIAETALWLIDMADALACARAGDWAGPWGFLRCGSPLFIYCGAGPRTICTKSSGRIHLAKAVRTSSALSL